MALDSTTMLQSFMNTQLTKMLTHKLYGPSSPVVMPESSHRPFQTAMRADGRTALQGAQNAQEAADMVSIAQSDVTAIKHKLGQMITQVNENALRDLTDVSDFQSGANVLRTMAQDIVNIAKASNHNGFQLMDGSAGENGGGDIRLQVGNATRDQHFFNLVDGTGVGDVDLQAFSNLFAEGGALDITYANGTKVTDSADVDKLRETARTVRDEIQKVFDQVASVETQYSYDIKSLNNQSLLLQAQADVFTDIWDRNQPEISRDNITEAFSSSDTWLRNAAIMSLVS